MRFKFFFVPMADSNAVEQELNGFLRSHRILTAKSEPSRDPGRPGWMIAVEYVDATPASAPSSPSNRSRTAGSEEPIDYAQVLGPEEFARFRVLRDIRNQIAREDRVQTFIVFTNAQIAAMSKFEKLDAAALGSVPGVGEGKMARYVERFLKYLELPPAGSNPT